ncbi:MAG: hypothetical protein QOK05_3017 [Chloroflexota bacterium]|nr:hypothetical protein [Chloroflexota bacterium]
MALVAGTLLAGGLLGIAAAAGSTILVVTVGAVMVALVIDATWRRPSEALILLVVLLPLYPVLFGLSQKFHVPSSALGYLRYWKEVVLVALLTRTVARTRIKDLAPVDWSVIAFLALGGLYVLLPIGPSFYARALGARDLCAALTLFLVVRHVGVRPGLGRRLETAVLLTGSLVAAVALWNYFSPDGYAVWIVGLAQWQADVLGLVGHADTPIYHTLVAGRSVVRAGSIFVNPLSAAFYMLIPVGLFIGRVAAGEARHPLERMLGALCVAGLLVTVTRSAIATLPLMLAIAILAGRKPGRTVALILVGGIVAYPLISSIGLGAQFSGALDPNQVSTAGHLAALGRDVVVITHVPLGLGLAQGGAEGQRFVLAGALTAESWYLQVAVELGVLGLVLFVIALGRTLRLLWGVARAGQARGAAALCALAGIAAGGVFLHSFSDLHISYTVWALAGLATLAQPQATTAAQH